MDERNDIDMAMVVIKWIVIVCFSLLTTFPRSHGEPPPLFNYSICKEELYNCGELSNIPYPFWGQNRAPECGGGDQFELQCHDDEYGTPPPTIGIDSQNLEVMDINTTSYTIRMRRTEYDVCSPEFGNTMNMSLTPFHYMPSAQNITIFYNCSHLYTFSCGNGNVTYYRGEEDKVFIKHPDIQNCERRVQVTATEAPPDPGEEGAGLDALRNRLKEEFDVYYNVSQECINCLKSGGVCGTDAQQKFSCYCPDGSSSPQCGHHKHTLNLWRKIILAVSAAMMGGFMMCIITCCCRYKSSMMGGFTMCIITCCCRYKSSSREAKFWFMAKHDQDIEAFLKNHEALAQKRYKFSEVKRMTNSFKVKLGQGGFGAVYKGQLHSDCPVAVKILNASKGNGEDFMNEVASISKTSHVNVVTLLGFCLEGHKKALIYEFMPNGSLDKFIYNKGLENTSLLSWDNLLQIALGIARGLEYLHGGCNTRILHFDIKPHNILLDENFNPKISDFGLAKLCPRNKSIVSMSDPRGTIGYLAPEMSNGRFGGVSHKSDVYSYGMILLDMVEGRKNTNAEASYTSEKYFPDWIYNELEQGDMRSDGVTVIEENEIARKITIVGLWCIQTFPTDRPTMSRVIEMLGNKNPVEIPPKPFLSSPPRSILESTTT